MAPPPDTTSAVPAVAQPGAAAPAQASKETIYHHGPDGTGLKGFAVRELNDFHYAVAATVKIPPVDPAVEASLERTTQGVDVKPYTLVTGPQDWVAADFRGEANAHKWHLVLSEADVEEVVAAAQAVEARGLKVEDLTKADFPLPGLGPKLEWVRDEVVLGKGFHLIRNFPVHRLNRFQTIAAYYAFGLYWGNPQAQNAKGHTVGHIKAIGTNASLEGVRPYTTNIPHGYHSDNSDLVALLCLHDAEEGGISHWASSVAVHNALLRRGRKDLVQVLTETDFYLPWNNVWGSPTDSWPEGSPPPFEWASQPPFIYYNNHLLTSFKEGAYYYSYKFPGAPRYTPLQEEALRTFTALAASDELRLDWKLQPGDIPLLNNLTMLHAKSAFRDSTDPAKARHLLRLWVSANNAAQLPPGSYYEKTWGSVEVGSRGGYWLGHAYTKHTPLDPEYGDLEETRPAHLKA